MSNLYYNNTSLCLGKLLPFKNKWKIYSNRECTYPINHDSHIYPQMFTIVDINDKVLYYYVVEFDENDNQTNIYKKKTKEDEGCLLKSKKLIMLCYGHKDDDKLIKLVDKTYIAKKYADEYEVSAWLSATMKL
jgi:hypothetical protein